MAEDYIITKLLGLFQTPLNLCNTLAKFKVKKRYFKIRLTR